MASPPTFQNLNTDAEVGVDKKEVAAAAAPQNGGEIKKLPLFLCAYTFLMVSCLAVLYVVHYGVRAEGNEVKQTILMASVAGAGFLIFAVLLVFLMPNLRELREGMAQPPQQGKTSLTTATEASSLLPGKDEKGSSSSRIPQVDYMKFMVNMFVVFHHAYECRNGKPDNTPFLAFYRAFSEPWLMPSMAMLSGLVFTPVLNQRRRYGVLQLCAGYFIVQAIYQLCIKTIISIEDRNSVTYLETLHTLNKPPGTVSLIDIDDPLPWARMMGNMLRPAGHLWFIWSMFMWRIIIPFWMDLRYPITCSVFMAMLCGFVQSDSLNIYRTLYFFPYYVIGNVIKTDGFRPLLLNLSNDYRCKVWGGLMVVFSIVSSWYAQHVKLCGWYFGAEYSYKQVAMMCAEGYQDGIDNRYWMNMFATLCVYPVAVGFVFSIIFIMPTIESPIRRAGERTLIPYVFHVFFLFLLGTCTYLTSDYRAQNVIPLFIVLYGFIGFIYCTPSVDGALRNLVLPPLGKWGMYREE